MASGVVRDDPITAMDLLPTLLHLAGGEMPDDRIIDGKNIWPLLSNQPGAKSPHEAIYYLRGRAIRVGDWKYRRDKDKPAKLTREQKRALRGKPKRKRQAVVVEALYNLRDDIGEQTNLIKEHPQLTARLKDMIDTYLDDLKAKRRPAGQAGK